MQWYFKDKNDGSRHGIVEETALFDMARKGEIKPTDLVWSDKTGGHWVQASTVEDLFPAQDGTKGKVVSIKTAPPPAFDEQREATKKKSVVPIALLLVFIGMVGGLGVVYLRGPGEKLKSTSPQELPAARQSETKPAKFETAPQPPIVPSPVIPPPAQSNPALVVVTIEKTAIIDQFNSALANEEVAKASKLLVDLAQSDAKTEKVQELSKRLNAVRQSLARSRQLEAALRSGNMDAQMAAEIVTVYDGRKKRNELVNMTKEIMTSTNALSPDVDLGIARVCVVLKDHEQTKAALSNYTTRVIVKTDLMEYIEAAKMFQSENDPMRGADLMQKYLAGDPTNPLAWFEYSAWKCACGDSDEAYEGLKKSVGYGGNDMKKKAQHDDRFKPIMDTRKFRRLTRTDE
jgi:hypothetical protein